MGEEDQRRETERGKLECTDSNEQRPLLGNQRFSEKQGDASGATPLCVLDLREAERPLPFRFRERGSRRVFPEICDFYAEILSSDYQIVN
jgi:hypothetical protein